jgi:hypothetical protein
VPLLHALVALIYVAFRLSLWLDERRKAAQVRPD